MKYRESQKDKLLRKKFTSDMAHAFLRRIILKEGTLRGLTSIDIKFEYPITAIAGRNGAGKSTILALACCAFHNSKEGFKLTKRNTTYYTFSDFFIQHAEEVGPEGIDIRYIIAHNNWKKTEHFPEGIGLASQQRQKKKGGKWNEYATRVKRNVAFLGIERIVPHSERSQSRSYQRVFREAAPKGWENKVKDAVGFILGRSYDKFRYLEHSKYSLPIVQVGNHIYSGFNMGAGENALFEIFSTIYSSGQGSLLVMDEVELGLHAEAQRRFIEKLKDVCLEMHIQVICTTHSSEIFECLPHDARYFVECIDGQTRITPEISSEFAFSKMAAVQGNELEIFVEDQVAKTIIYASIPTSLRSRITLKVIGSATALARQLAAISVRGEERATMALFDGDQKVKENENYNHAKSMCENPKPEFEEWYKKRIDYLPGEGWPEAWLIQKASEYIDDLTGPLSCDASSLKDIFGYAQQAGKHKELHEISRHLGLEREMCLHIISIIVCNKCSEDFKPLINKINDALKEGS